METFVIYSQLYLHLKMGPKFVRAVNLVKNLPIIFKWQSVDCMLVEVAGAHVEKILGKKSVRKHAIF